MLNYSEVAGIVDIAEADPRAAVARIETLEDSASVTEQIGTRWAAGIALRTLGDADRSIEEILIARDLASAARDDVLSADIDVTLAGSLAVAGRVDEGYLLVRDAGERLPDDLKPHAWVQEATFAARQGDLDGAFDLFERAELALTETGEMRWLGKLLNNRGLICVYVGQVDRAMDDLRGAIEIYSTLGSDTALAEANHNLGFANVERGDLAAGLVLYKAAEQAFRRLGCPLNELLLDHTEALIAAGMYGVASNKAAEIAAAVGDGTMALDRAETFFLYARSSFLAGDWVVAIEAADSASQAFLEVGAAGWGVRSELLKMRSQEHLGIGLDADAVIAVAQSSIDTGQLVAGWHGLLLAARVHVKLGELALAQDQVALVRRACSDAEIVIAELDLDVALTEIEIARVDGRSSDALKIANEAIRTANSAATTIAYSGQNASHATQRIEAIERIGTDLAMEEGASALILWTDIIRSAATQYPALVRSSDPDRASLLDRLRSIDGEMRETETVELAVERSDILGELSGLDSGGLHPATGAHGRARLILSRGTSDTYTSLQIGDESTLVSSAPTVGLLALADRLRVNTVSSGVGPGNREVALFQRRLLGDTDVGAQAITVSAPPDLVSFPWSLLASLGDKSIAIELPAGFIGAGRSEGTGSTIAVAGPGLAFANDEVRRVAATAVDGYAMSSSEVSRQAVLDAMSQVGVFHFAGHSVFRIDNPGASYLDLGEERLHVWELEQLTAVPRTVVLASCSSGGVGSAGVGVAGLVGTLIALGVREVVASVVPVPDAKETSDVMVALHSLLAQGSTAADALRRVKSTSQELLAHSFQVFV
jgi:tetratricopeptide (TPR) repeat protein